MMNLINNRYRIVKDLSQDRMMTSYLVSDVMNNHETLQLNIINSEIVSKSLIDFFIKEFVTLTSVNNVNIIKVIDFGLIHTIDNKKMNNTEYFYTRNYLENTKDFYELISNINENNILDIFAQICIAMNYLHLRGFVYGELNIDNLMISYDENRYKVMLKDFPAIEIQKQDYWTNNEGKLKFKAPEHITGMEPTIASDIYSMGVMLLALCNIDISEDFTINQSILNIKNKDDNTNLIIIIKKMINQNIANRYKNINEIVKDINELFNKEYNAYNKDEIEKLNFHTKIVGRDAEIIKIMKVHENFIEHKTSRAFILVHGEQGIGKTRLLKEADHLLSMEKVNLYSSFILENSNTNSNRAFIDILKKIVSECDEEILERYQSELIKFIPKIGEKNNIKASEILNGEKEKYRLISRIYSFIKEYIRNKPTIFIIDNAHCLDDFSIEFLEYINMQSSNDRNIMIILSYSDGKYSTNSKFLEFTNNKVNYENIHLETLNKDETAIMIQRILSMPRTSVEFATRVYDKTYGNPLFVEETIKDFLLKKILYINNTNGSWAYPFDNIEDMPIASTMEQALLNQIREIDSESYEILKIISIFSVAVSAPIIRQFFSYTEVILDKYISNLILKGILCKKIEDRGFVFDFYNKVLKNLIYNKLSKEERKSKHKAAVFVLDKLFESEGREDKEELIYHLEKAGDKNKVAKYCMEIGIKMEKLKIMDEAIVNYKKAYIMLSPKKNKIKKVELLLKIGNIYSEVGDLSIALLNYKKAYRLTVKLENLSLQVDAINKIADIYYKKNEVENSLTYIKKAEDIFLHIEHKLGYLQNRKILANIYILKQEYEKVFEICTSSIKLCEKEHVMYKGFMHNILGNMYTETSKTIESLDSYYKAMKYFEEINYPQGMVTCLNNIGVIYGDHYQDNKKAITYYTKIKVICEENNILDLEVLALTNIASANMDNFDYDVALKYFKVALEKSKRIEYEANTFYLYNYLSYIAIKMGNNEEAYDYHSLAEKELEQYPIHGKFISVFYQMGAEFYYALGDAEFSYSLIKKALEIYNNDGTTQDNDSKLLLLIIEIYKAENTKDLKEDIKNVIDSYINDVSKINALYEICISLYERGFTKEATILFEEERFSIDNILIDVVEVKGLYLKGLIYKDKNKFKNLMKALHLSKKIKNKSLQWRICSVIGEYYFSKMNYFYAANYYFEACEIIKDFAMQLPKELRVNYINANHMIRPFKMIDLMSRRYNYSKIAEIQENKDIIASDEDLINLFNYDNFAEILNNKYFTKSAKKIYSSILPKGIHDINDIIINMGENSVKILADITKLLSSMVFSTRSLIISEVNNSEHLVIAASDGSQDVSDIKLILERVKETKSPVFISETFNNKKNTELKIMPKGIKAVICIPIMTKDYFLPGSRKKVKEEINKSTLNLENVKGYLYMESERVLNNFNENSLKRCVDLTSFISFIMDNYLLKISASIDKLTGTLTRKFLEEALFEYIEITKHNNGVFSIIMFDLDDFKGVNDRFGHQTGDEVLREVSKIVMDSIRTEDICGRYGGEEFIVILPGTDTTLANKVAERVRVNIQDKKILGTKRDITISMGISTYPIHAKWKQELVEKADQALYVAKENGKNRCQIWEDKFSGKVKGTNKLSGIVSGNVVQDSRNVLAMVELIELIKSESNFENKIYNSLGRIIETTEAKNAMFFIVKENKINEKYGRKIFKENWMEVKGYNKNIIESVIMDKQGTCMIDWDDIIGYDKVTGMPNWNSVLVVPLINSGVVKGILYLTVPIKFKEFKLEDLNFVNILGQLLVAML